MSTGGSTQEYFENSIMDISVPTVCGYFVTIENLSTSALSFDYYTNGSYIIKRFGIIFGILIASAVSMMWRLIRLFWLILRLKKFNSDGL